MTVDLHVETLDAAAFEPYGRVIDRPARGNDARGLGWTWWGETQSLDSDGRSWAFGYLDLEPAPSEVDWAERHMRSQEVILATSRDLLVYVGPPENLNDAERMPPLESFRVFRVAAGTGVVLHPGVWHGAPLSPDGETNALVLLLERTGSEDVTVVRFPDTPIRIREG